MRHRNGAWHILAYCDQRLPHDIVTIGLVDAYSVHIVHDDRCHLQAISQLIPLTKRAFAVLECGLSFHEAPAFAAP